MSSLDRAKVDEICQHIKTNPDTLFGQKYWQCRHACVIQIQQKPERWETRFLAIAKFRVFLLNGKSLSSLKLERSFNILALRHLELLQQEQVLQIGWEERAASGRQNSPATVVHLFARMPDGSKGRELALELLGTLKHYFPEIQKSLSKLFTSLVPPSLLSEFSALPTSIPELPCHNFRRSYVAYCDWMEQPFRDEVIWDIERIYFYHGQHDLDLNDFSHLTTKDQQALIGSIQFSDFFTGLRMDGLRLQHEHMEAITLLIRRSHSLKSFHLNRCNVPKDFLQQMATALALNINLPLERIKLSAIPLDDRKGLSLLANVLPQVLTFHSLSLPDCSLNEKAALALLHGLHHGIEIANESSKAEDGDGGGQHLRHGFQLKVLNLSGNLLGTGVELAEQLANLLALNNGAIRLLDLSGTAVQLDRLWAALKLGGSGLEVLRLGGCHIGQIGKRNNASGKDNAQVARELFAGFKSLRELNLTGTQLNAELLQGIIKGLNSNENLPSSSLFVCLDNCMVSSAPCVSVLEQNLPDCSSIRLLSLRDNSLEHETFRLLSAISQMQGIRSLDLGGANFFGLKANKKHAQTLGAILAELVKLVNDVDEQKTGAPLIEELLLSDSRLGSHLGVLLNALGLSRTLKRLDLSNCDLGPGGARLLGKSLQLNQSLRYLSIDRNQIGPDGFVELSRALQLNTTLLHLQLPLSDLTDSMLAFSRSPMDRSRLMVVMAEIEQALERNGQLAAEGQTKAQLAMQTMHALNKGCDRYEVNGEDASDVKKVAFHKISKLVAKLGEEDSNQSENGGQQENGTRMCTNSSAYKRDRLVEHLAEQVEQSAQESSENFLRKFMGRLSEQEGVEIKQPSSNGHLKNGLDDSATSELGEKLRQNLASLVDKYTSAFEWNHLFNRMDNVLCATESQNCFSILEKPSKYPSGETSSSTPRRGILVRGGGGNTPAPSSLNHRPVSAMMVEERQRQQNGGSTTLSDIMTRSVMGNFALNESGDDKDGQEKKKKTQQQVTLVHLAKHRPKPARLVNRGGRGAGAGSEQHSNSEAPIEEKEESCWIDEEKTEEEEEEENAGMEAQNGNNSSSIPTSSAAILPSLAVRGSSGSTISLELENSPLMQQQRLKHQQQEAEMEEKSIIATTTTIEESAAATSSPPPPIPKKGTRESSNPPKLPPKPSPNAEDLRNKKCRVLPQPEEEE